VTSGDAGINGLHLRHAAIHEQFRSRDVTAVVGCEKHHGPGDLIGYTEPAERNSGGIIFKRCSPAPVEATRSFSPGVVVREPQGSPAQARSAACACGCGCVDADG